MVNLDGMKLNQIKNGNLNHHKFLATAHRASFERPGESRLRVFFGIPPGQLACEQFTGASLQFIDDLRFLYTDIGMYDIEVDIITLWYHVNVYVQIVDDS